MRCPKPLMRRSSATSLRMTLEMSIVKTFRRNVSTVRKNFEIKMQTTSEFYCAYCGEPNVTFVDLSAGGQQSYIEDCQVCCRPNILYLRVDEETLDIEIDTEYEG
jgi:hypothetical protein